MKSSLIALVALTAHLAAAAPKPIAAAPNCFPYGTAQLPKDLSVPNVTLSDWWCPQSMAYGFQGFSYPMEDGNCNSRANSFDQMNKDFRQMKQDFGATIVRMYYPVCTETFIFERALEAAVANNMAIMFQVWTNFGNGVSWHFKNSTFILSLKN